MSLPARVETVIVGAGQAGLTMSWYLHEAGREHLLAPVDDLGAASGHLLARHG